MNFLKILFFVILTAQICLPITVNGAHNPGCWKNPTFVAAMDLKKGQELLDSYNKTHDEKIPKEEREPLELTRVYLADINNDGKSEYIFVFQDQSGSWHSELVTILRENNGRLESVGDEDDLPKPGGDVFYFWTHWNSGKDEFLTQLCGKTYIRLDKADKEGYSYLWQNDIMRYACDKDWANYERFKFQKLYDKHLYDEAFTNLNRYITICKDKVDTKLYLWIQNDLALAALKSGNPNESNNILQKITSHQAYSNTTNLFKKAVSFNKTFCSEELNKPQHLDKPWGKNEYSWILHLKSLPKDVAKKNLKKLILQSAPSASADKNSNQSFAAKIRKYFEQCMSNGLDFIDNSDIKDHRYVTMLVKWPQDASSKAFIWVDIQEGTSLIGFTGGYMPSLNLAPSITPITLASRNYTAATIPLRAKHDIKASLIQDDHDESFTGQTVFYDMETRQRVVLPKNWWK